MRYLADEEEKRALTYMSEALREALGSTCERAKCGSIVVKNGVIIGRGHNSPPADLESQRRCSEEKDSLDKKVTDKTCCVHAEQRAILDALRRNPDKICDSRIYFIRLDQDALVVRAGKPYCTHCSKIALDVGISEFVLWHEEGICVYNTEEYNLLSYNFGKEE